MTVGTNITPRNIDAFVKEFKCKRVINAILPSMTDHTYEPESLWSEDIFGTFNSELRNKRFGYIELGSIYVSPEFYNIFSNCSDEFYHLCRMSRQYIFDKKEGVFNEIVQEEGLQPVLPEVKDIEVGQAPPGLYNNDENGYTGLRYLLDNIHEVNFAKLTPRYNKSEKIDAVKKQLSDILLTKIPVLPAGLRDINIYSSGSTMSMQVDINTYYAELLESDSYTMGGDPDSDAEFTKNIQAVLVKITTWLEHSYIKGKSGLFRSTLLKKRLDFSARLILLSSPTLGIGEIKIPFHILFSIYQPLCYHHIIVKRDEELIIAIQEFMKISILDDRKFIEFSKFMADNPDKIPASLKALVIKNLEKFMADQVVIAKRDPVLNKNSYLAAVPIIGDGRVGYIPTLALVPLGGDSDGDTIMIAPIFSTSAKKNAMDTLSYVSMDNNHWKDPTNYGASTIKYTLDSISTLYSMTNDTK